MKLEFLQKELERTTDWIQSADRKIAFLIALNSFLVSFVRLNFSHLNLDTNIQIILWALIVSSLINSIFFTVVAVFPRLKNSISDKNILFFGNVAKMKYKDYFDSYLEGDEKKMRENFIEQIYTNSNIVNAKMKNIEKSILSVSIAIIIISILLVKQL